MDNKFLIVGLGASAGGIQALQHFFEHVPAGNGMAYVVILHLSPDHDSRLAEILQRYSELPVIQVTNRTKVEPENVYVAPPGRHFIMEGDELDVVANIAVEDRRTPIDIFLRSLAESHQSRAICVILSGTGADGSVGLKRIKEKGGTVFVQDPREAEFNEMPRNAISTGLVDDVLPVAGISQKIIAYRQSLGTVEIPADPGKLAEDQQLALREIFTQLRFHTGHDFTNYKRATLFRRIERRINIHNLPNLTAYANFLQGNPPETIALFRDLLISVTNFFRDQKTFEALDNTVLAQIIKRKTPGDHIRIWVAGCATGEEAYSIAMLCAERILNLPDPPKVQVFASDIDESAIEHAREGFYSINDTADVSPERLRSFFTPEGNGYRVLREIRDMILFVNHNFIKDPPFSRIDLVSCRNTLIYLNAVAQERVLETFHFALNPGGYLLLGLSESTDASPDRYAPISREHHIFQSKPGVRSRLPEWVSTFRFEQLRDTPTTAQNKGNTLERIMVSDLHQRLLEQYAPPSIVVNEEYDIVHLSERAGKYLQVSGGELSQNLFKLIRQELRTELRTALYKAVQRQANVESRGIKIKIDDRTEVINIHIRPVLRDADITKGFILILFEHDADDNLKSEAEVVPDETLAQHFEEQLVRSKAQLRASVEQHEFQSEELRSSHEELQAMNEELATSKEELQSMNDELRTVNEELKVKIEETTLSGNNLQNLINSVDIGTIFLDRSFRIAMFTPAASDIFNLIPADHGRPLSDITHRLDYNAIIADAQTVLDKLHVVKREVKTIDGRLFMMRLLPYRTADDHINGVVITFIDITDLKKSESDLHQSELRFRILTDAIPQIIWTNDRRGNANYFNRRWYEFTGLSFDASPGLGWQAVVHPDDARVSIEKWKDSFREKNIFDTEFRLRRTDGVYRWFIVRNVPLFSESGEMMGWFGTATDIEHLKNVQEALHESRELMRITMESATDYGIITMDAGGDIVSWSKGAENIFGYTESEVIGKPGHIVFTPEDIAANVPEQEISKARREGKALDERWHIRKNGNRFYASGVMTAISDSAMSGFVKVVRDMTEQKLQQQHKDEFIGIASHELKTPVTSLKVYGEVLEQKFKRANDEQSSALMHKLNGQINRLTDLIRDLLDTTNISEGKLSLTLEDFDINQLIAERVEDVQRIATNHKLIVNAGTSRSIRADKERIGQVLINLLSNAVKYSPAGGEVIIQSSADNGNVMVSVSDKGIGIPKELQSRVFERFFRITSPRSSTYPGMGLGLYISAGIVQRHGGSISVESIPGEGSTFCFTLPYNK